MNQKAEIPAEREPASRPCSPQDEHCITCSDQAQPARVLSVDHTRGLAVVEIEQNRTEVDITLIEDATPGDTLLVHGGVALALWL